MFGDDTFQGKDNGKIFIYVVRRKTWDFSISIRGSMLQYPELRNNHSFVMIKAGNRVLKDLSAFVLKQK